ncbi:MAG: hypothetical protein COA75_10315 [Cellvibrionales bacterium]|nr:MAG: hypothetical protein COA75_10315 [Cellvibrionales bacterium]
MNGEQVWGVLSNSIQLMPEDLVVFVERIAVAVESSVIDGFFDALIITVIGAISGAIAAFLFSFFHWKLEGKRNAVAETALSLKEVVFDFESIAIKYWLTDFKVEELVECQTCEIRIKSFFKLIVKYSRLLSSLSLNNRGAEIAKSIESFSDSVFDLTTGGEFESVNRKPSKGRAAKIAIDCAKVRAELLEIGIRS